MKMRCGFVTNSSSSNMILAIKKPLDMERVFEGLLYMKDKDTEKFAMLPAVDDLKDFAIQLTGLVAGPFFYYIPALD